MSLRFAYILSIGLGIYLLFAAAAQADTVLFADNFNRLDSSSVGNGWLNDDIGGGTLSIQNNELANASGLFSAIRRTVQFSGPVTVSADLFEGNGFGGLPRKYGMNFYIKSDDAANGYGVGFARSDINYPSEVSLIDNGVTLARIHPSFEYGPEIHVTFTIFSDGSITGNVSQPGNSFNFSFPPRSVVSTGSNFTVYMGPHDNQASAQLIPSIDDLVITGNNPTPAELSQNLNSAVNTLNAGKNIQNSYLAHLQKIPQFIAAGQNGPAINQLDAFIKKVNQDFAHGLISSSQKDYFIAQANALKGALL